MFDTICMFIHHTIQELVEEDRKLRGPQVAAQGPLAGSAAPPTTTSAAEKGAGDAGKTGGEPAGEAGQTSPSTESQGSEQGQK